MSDQNLSKNLEFIELANEVDQLRFLVEVLMGDFQDLLQQAPAQVQAYFQAKRVLHQNNVITYDVGKSCYLVNGIPMSLDIIRQSMERTNTMEAYSDVLRLAPVFKVR
jgi:hypothetical protein